MLLVLVLTWINGITGTASLSPLCYGYPFALTLPPGLTTLLPLYDLVWLESDRQPLSSLLRTPSHPHPPPPRLAPLLRCATGSTAPLCDVALASLEALPGNSTHASALLRFTSDVEALPLGAGAGLLEQLQRLVALHGGGWGGTRVVAAEWAGPAALSVTRVRGGTGADDKDAGDTVAAAGEGEGEPMYASLVNVLHVGAPFPPSTAGPGCGGAAGGDALLPPTLSHVALLLGPNAPPPPGDDEHSSAAVANIPPPRCEARLTPAPPGRQLLVRACGWRSPLRALTSASEPVAAAAAWQASIACFEAADSVAAISEGNPPAAAAAAALFSTLSSACPCTELAAAPQLPFASCGGGAPVTVGAPTPPPVTPPPTALRAPHLSFAGVAAVGARGIRFPAASLPGANGTAAWTWSSWLWLWEGGEDPGAPRGPRTFFFKGLGGGDQGRSPSAWFDTGGSQHLLLRVSTTNNWDAGGASIGALPVRKWVHVAFTFSNKTTTKSGGGGGGGEGGGTTMCFTRMACWTRAWQWWML